MKCFKCSFTWYSHKSERKQIYEDKPNLNCDRDCFNLWHTFEAWRSTCRRSILVLVRSSVQGDVLHSEAAASHSEGLPILHSMYSVLSCLALSNILVWEGQSYQSVQGILLLGILIALYGASWQRPSIFTFGYVGTICELTILWAPLQSTLTTSSSFLRSTKKLLLSSYSRSHDCLNVRLKSVWAKMTK